MIKNVKSLLDWGLSNENYLFAKHLVLETRDHRLAMAYSKGYEVANNIDHEIKKNVLDLIHVFSDKEPYILLMDHLLISGTLRDIHFDTKIIRFFVPWSFYLEETHKNKKLVILTSIDDMVEEEYILDKHESYRIEKNKNPFETLLSLADKIKTRFWIEKNGI